MATDFTMTNIEELAQSEGGLAAIGAMGQRLEACKSRLAAKTWPGMLPTDQETITKIDRGLSAAIVVLARFMISKSKAGS